MAEHNDFGKLAEELAEQFLVEKNYKILAKNFRFQKAEVDIITEFEIGRASCRERVSSPV